MLEVHPADAIAEKIEARHKAMREQLAKLMESNGQLAINNAEMRSEIHALRNRLQVAESGLAIARHEQERLIHAGARLIGLAAARRGIATTLDEDRRDFLASAGVAEPEGDTQR